MTIRKSRRTFWFVLALLALLSVTEFRVIGDIPQAVHSWASSAAVAGATLLVIALNSVNVVIALRLFSSKGYMRADQWAMVAMPLGTSLFGLFGSLIIGKIWLQAVANVVGLLSLLWLPRSALQKVNR